MELQDGVEEEGHEKSCKRRCDDNRESAPEVHHTLLPKIEPSRFLFGRPALAPSRSPPFCFFFARNRRDNARNRSSAATQQHHRQRRKHSRQHPILGSRQKQKEKVLRNAPTPQAARTHGACRERAEKEQGVREQAEKEQGSRAEKEQGAREEQERTPRRPHMMSVTLLCVTK